jgi:hypothetical protein
MAKQRRKAQMGLVAVAVVLLGCLGVLLSPTKSSGETPKGSATQVSGQSAAGLVTPSAKL